MRACNQVRLLGKRRFASGGVQISVDESFESAGIEYLIEVDSGNMAKLLVGQYVLLNILHTEQRLKPFFLIVHTYKRYNPLRTVRNLQVVNENLFAGNGMSFGALHVDQLAAWNGDLQDMLRRVRRPQATPFSVS